MLRGQLLHPEILSALGRAGHGTRVLIADANFPFSTGAPATAARVFLNLRPGLVEVTDVLEVMAQVIPIEAAAVMVPADGAHPAIFEEFRRHLPRNLELTICTKQDFYQLAAQPQTALLIATGERRRFANLLLTIGVIKQEEPEG